jgi:hypothetical protein
MGETLLARHADVLVTMDDERREIGDGAVFVRGNRIASSRRSTFARTSSATTASLGSSLCSIRG